MNKYTVIHFLALIILLTSTAISVGPAAFADSSSGGPAGKIVRELNLTDSQTEQLKPLLKNARQQFKAIRQNTTMTPDQKKLAIQTLKQQLRTEVDQILSPAQQQELAAIRAKYRQERQQSKLQQTSP